MLDTDSDRIRHTLYSQLGCICSRICSIANSLWSLVDCEDLCQGKHGFFLSFETGCCHLFEYQGTWVLLRVGIS